ncbi:universal stress protein [Ramlibacter sp. USB13]|uniref:Universal stress protein n=1 Tax=Ramlibacter cellulosilyticus TaxID=2764187 RepID=A0A923MQ08_9BURK|nr:universal stress protein [Ramlibacter cellulosilyticus]MBC5783113.1 universal stress protein [Ramlibacter cellulosilyticus]
MKILLAADGSSYTKKALAFLVTHEALAGDDGHIVVVNVQAAVPPRVKSMVGATAVNEYHADEASKVLRPIEKFLQRHDLSYTTRWAVGVPGQEIVKAAKKEKAHMIVMGTHGHGILGRALLGSVAQNVLTQCDIPVLLVK